MNQSDEGTLMPSPFPGMNPYLESDSVWQDFHQAYCSALRDSLVPQIRPHYFAKVNEHLFVREADEDTRRILLGRADVGITPRQSMADSESTVAVLEAPCAVQIPQAMDVEHCAFIEIYSRNERELIAVIELLSPTNKKSGKDREQFIAKRREILDSAAHYIEIDLLRGGPRMPAVNMPDGDYCVIVSRKERRPEMGLWPLKLHDRLPPIPVPLRAPHRDAVADLQSVLDRVYDAAGYEDHIYD